MQPLTSEGQEQLRSIAERYGVSVNAAQTLLEALMRGSGSMAQFSHPELGGSGQWMRGGMTMIGDMFNNGLKATVDGLCNELSRLLERAPFVPLTSMQHQHQSGGSVQTQASGGLGWSPLPSWWPGELGQPTSSGSQNDLRYAYFAGPRRLAIEHNGVTNVYDTLDHQIGGVSQQQGGGYSLTFSSQYGTVDLARLPLVSTNAPGGFPSTAAAPPPSDAEGDVFQKLERLGELKQRGLITEQEFADKKRELLSRI